jgi:hypothetical protein
MARKVKACQGKELHGKLRKVKASEGKEMEDKE